MRKLFDRLVTFILSILAITVFAVTTYVCLEFFDIIEVPEQYSLVKFLYSKMEVVTSVQDYVQNVIEDKDFDDIWESTETIVVELGGNTVTTIHLQDEEQPSVEQMPQTQPQAQTLTNFKYYDQLDEYAKKMYDAIETNKEGLKTGTYKFDFDTEFDDLLHEENGSQILNNSFQLAVNSFLYDHPEIFYVDITQMYLLTEITTRPFSKTYRVSIGANETDYLFDEYTSQEDVEFAINQVEQIKESIKQNATGSTYDKIKYVHDYLIETAEYEKTVESHNNYNIYGALVSRKAVCEGYAKAFKYILDDMGIPCVMACGIAKNSSGQTESHAWNYVILENSWYAVDVTWDDPVIIGSGYLTSDSKYKYFLKGSNSFFADHIEDGTILDVGTFVYPTLNSVDY